MWRNRDFKPVRVKLLIKSANETPEITTGEQDLGLELDDANKHLL